MLYEVKVQPHFSADVGITLLLYILAFENLATFWVILERLKAIFELICCRTHLPLILNKSHLQAGALRFPQGGEGECLISPFSRILHFHIWDFYIFSKFPTVSTFNISGFSGGGQPRRQQHIYLSLHAARCAQEAARPNRQTPKCPIAKTSICKKWRRPATEARHSGECKYNRIVLQNVLR